MSFRIENILYLCNIVYCMTARAILGELGGGGFVAVFIGDMWQLTGDR